MNELTLDPYALMVGFYDQWSAHMTEDIAFYVKHAAAVKGPIVELGAGTGRISIPVAEAGQRVIAVDVSSAMLTECARRADMAGVAEKITFVLDDMRSFVADPSVELVIIPFRAFGHLMTIDDQLAALAAIKGSLAPGGRLIFNIFTPDPEAMVRNEGQRRMHTEFVDERGRRNEVWVEPRNELATQLLRVHVIQEVYDADRLVDETDAEFQLHMTYPFEVEHLLARAGFEVEALYGDFDEKSYGPGPDEMIWIARKP